MNFSLSLRQFAKSDFAAPALGMARLGLTLSACDALAVGFLMFVRSPSRSGPALLAVGFSHIGFASLPRNSACVGLFVSSLGCMRMGFLLPVLSETFLDFLMPVHSSGRLDSAVFAVDFSTLGSSASLRSFARLDSVLSAADSTIPGSALPLQSFGCFDFLPLTFDFGNVGLSTFLQSSA